MTAIKERGLSLVLASSGKQKHVDAYLDLLEGRTVADAWTTSDDVDDSKPAPDLLQVAIDKVSGTSAIKIGDSVWDCRAADEAGVPCRRCSDRRLLARRAAGSGQPGCSRRSLNSRQTSTPSSRPSRLEHDLDAAVLLLLEHFVCPGAPIEGGAVSGEVSRPQHVLVCSSTFTMSSVQRYVALP